MIPVKIISLEQARRLGLTEKGVGISGAGIVQGKKNDKDEIITFEKTLIKEDGTKELTFMSEERKLAMKDKKKLDEYLDQFNVIEGTSKEIFFAKNDLKSVK